MNKDHQRAVLAVDCGSTNLKGALFRSCHERVADASVPLVYLKKGAEEVEFDPQELWRAVSALIEELCTASGIRRDWIGGVAIASQAQSFTLVDAGSTPLCPFFSWIDKRADEEARELDAEFGQGFHQHCSFAHPLPQLQAAKLLWLYRRFPDLIRGARAVMSVADFVSSRICGAHTADRNLAAMGGLYSLSTGTWWPHMLAKCGLHRTQLPEVHDAGHSIRGPHAARHGFAPNLHVLSAGNDQTAGAFGNGCGKGRIVVTLGTALVVYRYTGTVPGPYHEGGCWGPYPRGGYYELATRDEGCLALDWAAEQLMPGGSIETFMARCRHACEEQQHEPDQGWFFYPCRIGRADAWQGAGDDGRQALAVVEGLTFSLKELLAGELKENLADAVVCVTGGGSANGFWLQLLADAFGCSVYRGTGDSLLGAAMMAFGISPTAGTNAVSLVRPRSDRVRQYAARYEVWRRNAPHEPHPGECR